MRTADAVLLGAQPPGPLSPAERSPLSPETIEAFNLADAIAELGDGPTAEALLAGFARVAEEQQADLPTQILALGSVCAVALAHLQRTCGLTRDRALTGLMALVIDGLDSTDGLDPATLSGLVLRPARRAGEEV